MTSITDLLGLGLLAIVGVALALLVLPTSLLALAVLAVIGVAAIALADGDGGTKGRDRSEPYRAVDRVVADTQAMDARAEALGELRDAEAIDGPLMDMDVEPRGARVDDDGVEAELDTLKASSDTE